MSVVLPPPLPPMEAKSVEEIPTADGWQCEPKWDGFRCLAFRRGKEIYLQSKSGQPLARYFPDIVVALSRLAATKFVDKRSEEHTSELQSQSNLVCRLLLEKKNKIHQMPTL